MLGVLTALSGCLRSSGDQDDYQVLPSLYELQQKKIERIQALNKSSNRHVNGEYVIPKRVHTSPTQSGYGETLLFSRNASVRIVGDIGFHVNHLVGRLTSDKSDQPLVLDNPQSFSIDVLQGDITLSPKAVEAILNEHIFNFLTSTLKQLRVSIEGDLLVMNGFVKRKGAWIPFTLKGSFSIKNGRFLVLHAKEVLMDGDSATKLLRVAKIELDELLTIKAPGAELKGSSIWLDTRKLLPPPQINFLVNQVAVTPAGVNLKLKTLRKAAYPNLMVQRDSYIVIRSGDMRIMRLLTLNSEFNIVPRQADERLDFSFYDYRKQISQGSLKLLKNGGAVAFVQNYKYLEK
ncbi:MAG: hypothetical protein AAGF06_04275 [Pseudomonadota bacterium]